MILTLLSLVAVALLSLVLLSTTFHSGDDSSTNLSHAPGVAQADDLVAQQALSTALTSVGTAAANAGGYGALDVATLSASDPTVSYVAGPTTSASTVSIAVTGGASGGSAGAGVPGGAIGAAINGASGGSDESGGSAGSGTVTLAARSSDGTCWLVWKGDGTATWYGAQTGLGSCTAPALTSAPDAGTVTSSSIGWQPGSFPPG